MSLALHPLESISLNSLVLLEHADFNIRNKLLTQKVPKQGYRYHKLRTTFSYFYRRYYDLISKFQIGLKSLLHQGLSEPEFYGDWVYTLKKIFGSNNFSKAKEIQQVNPGEPDNSQGIRPLPSHQ